jgi:portal protein
MSDDKILEEIRERFDYGTAEWKEIRDEGAKDMRYLSGDPWDPEERRARDDAGRPAISQDELNQYVNQLINDARQNKRGIKYTPIGEGANDETARHRQGLARQIEYRSNAQQGAYIVGLEGAASRGYGFWRLKAQFDGRKSFDQELRIEPLPNPDLVTMDPDGQRTDGSDWQWGFIHESRSEKEFGREFPDADTKKFREGHIELAPAWFKIPGRTQVAEYWTIHYTERRLLQLKPPSDREDPIAVFEDDLQKLVKEKQLAAMPTGDAILQMRVVQDPEVRQYVTNGIEILRKKGQKDAFVAWPTTSIPIVPCLGRVMYVDEGGAVTRKLMSLIRLARDPQMLLCFYVSTEVETVGMTPKTPFIGYKGQFRGVEAKWASVNIKPEPYLEVEPYPDQNSRENVLPLPQRQPYEPPIPLLEVGKESARRAIQAAIGTFPLPTAAQRRNDKSGKALQQIDETAQKGSFHFIDHFDESITRTGQLLEELIPFYYDTKRSITIRKPDDSAEVIRINDPFDKKSVDMTTGVHDATVSTGPSFDSEREAASQFADVLASNEAIFARVADLVVKLKNLGPIGDEIAKRLTPPEFQQPKDGEQPTPEQMQQMLAQQGAKLKQCEAMLAEAMKRLETDQVKGQATIDKANIDAEASLKRQAMQDATTIRVAEMNAAAKGYAVNAQHAAAHEAQAGAAVYESVEADAGRQHERELTERQHEQTLEQADQGAVHTLGETAAAAAMQPAGENGAGA